MALAGLVVAEDRMAKTLALALMAALTGCATIVQGPMQRVAFDTQPPGASVRADLQSCTTPCSLLLQRNHNVEARIRKDGYEAETVLVRYDLDPWIIGNLAFMFLAPIGGIVDIVSGAGFRLYPPAVYLPLRALEGPGAAPDPGQPSPGNAPAGDAEWKPIPGSREL